MKDNNAFLKNVILYGSLGLVITFLIVWIFVRNTNNDQVIGDSVIRDISLKQIHTDQRIVEKNVDPLPLLESGNVVVGGKIIFASSVSSILVQGDILTLSGNLASAGNIVGYTSPTTYYVKEVDGTDVTLSTMPYIPGGDAQTSITTVSSTNPSLEVELLNYNPNLDFEEAYDSFVILKPTINSDIELVLPSAESVIVGNDLGIQDSYPMIVRNNSGHDQKIAFPLNGYTYTNPITILEDDIVKFTFVVLNEPYEPTPYGLIGLTYESLTPT